jgi:hypothetical protein
MENDPTRLPRGSWGSTVARDASFDRKLEQLLVKRLQAGEPADDLLKGLQARLTTAEAEQLLARAEARVAKQASRAASTPLAARIVMVLVYVWILVLILQNIGVLFALKEIVPAPGDGGPATWVGMTLLKIGMLCAAAFAFSRWPAPASAGALAAAIMYAFPVGRVVEGWLGLGFGPQNPAILVSGSALPSYVAAGLVAFAYWWPRRTALQLPPLDTFD